MSPVTSLPGVSYSVTIENVMMCYLLTQADAADHTDRDAQKTCFTSCNCHIAQLRCLLGVITRDFHG